MFRILLVLAIIWRTESVFAQIQCPYDGNALMELIGMDVNDPRVQELRSFLAEDPNTQFSASTWFSRQKGLELSIEENRIHLLFVHGRSPQHYSYMPFVGTFVLGLRHTDTEAEIVKQLGEPARREKWGALLYYVAHEGSVYIVSIELNNDRNSIRHAFIKKDTGGLVPNIQSRDFGGSGRRPGSTQVSNMGGTGVNVMKSAGATGCVQGNCNNGMGTFLWENGSKYIGQWKNGTRTGFGTYYFINGDVYIGEWADNYRHGNGIMEFASKIGPKKYIGEWRAGKKSGWGTTQAQDGSCRLGQWKEDQLAQEVLDMPKGCVEGDCKSQESQYVWEDDASFYIGAYENGLRNGQGTYYYPKGGKYVGEFKNGLRHGYGIYYYPNGSRYEGNWEADKRQGQGTIQRKGGQVVSGIWHNDQLGI